MITKTPKLNNGGVLTKAVLENLRDYPLEFISVNYTNHSDGIISGLKLSFSDKKIFVGKGIFKLDNNVFIVKEEFIIEVSSMTEQLGIIKISVEKKDDDFNFNIFEVKAFIDKNMELNHNEIELGRLRIMRGAYLITDYKNLGDFIEYNSLDLRYVKYSSEDTKGTVHPLILKTFANEILVPNANIAPLDYSFAYVCLNSDVVKKSVIIKYLQMKLGIKKDKELETWEIFDYLRQALKAKTASFRPSSIELS